MSTSVTWLGQGGYAVSSEGARVVIDPYLSDSLCAQKRYDEGFRRLVPPPALPEAYCADTVIATHPHTDHLDAQTVVPMQANVRRFAGPTSCVDAMKSMGLPSGKLALFDRGAKLREGPIILEAVYANHTEDSIGVVATVPEGSMYFVGDSLLDDQLLALPIRPDIIFCCINGRLGNMDVREAARLAKALDVRAAVPCHYGLFAANTEDPHSFVRAMEGSGIQVSVLSVGVPYSFMQLLGGV